MERIYPESNPYVVLGEPNRFLGEDLEELKTQILEGLDIKLTGNNNLTALTIICSGAPEFSFMLKYLDPA